MTPDQGANLIEHITSIKAQLIDIANNTSTSGTLDDHEANQMIANFRTKLQDIDMQLFECYRLIESPLRFFPKALRRPPSIDDLEI